MKRQRWFFAVFIPSAIITCWLGMMLVHEAGHMLAALLSGGSVERLIFPLGSFSRTDISPNPHPLFVVWAGPLVGAILPLLISLGFRVIRLRLYLMDLFAAFCMLANGAYVACGAWGRIGDAGDMLRYGSPLWMLEATGLGGVGMGFLLLHRLGPRMGLPQVGRADAIVSVIASILLIVLSWWAAN